MTINFFAKGIETEKLSFCLEPEKPCIKTRCAIFRAQKNRLLSQSPEQSP